MVVDYQIISVDGVNHTVRRGGPFQNRQRKFTFELPGDIKSTTNRSTDRFILHVRVVGVEATHGTGRSGLGFKLNNVVIPALAFPDSAQNLLLERFVEYTRPSRRRPGSLRPPRVDLSKPVQNTLIIHASPFTDRRTTILFSALVLWYRH